MQVQEIDKRTTPKEPEKTEQDAAAAAAVGMMYGDPMMAGGPALLTVSDVATRLETSALLFAGAPRHDARVSATAVHARHVGSATAPGDASDAAAAIWHASTAAGHVLGMPAPSDDRSEAATA